MTKSESPISPRCANGRCGWSSSIRANTLRSGQRSVDRGQDRLLGRDAAQLGAAGRARPRAAARTDNAGAGADQGAGAGEPGTAAGQRDPAQGVGVFCAGGARPPIQAMIAFIDEHRAVYGVEPICRVLPIAPSTYYAHAAAAPIRHCCRREPGATPRLRPRSGGSWRRTSRCTACARSGGSCCAKASQVARCTVERLMRRLGLEGVRARQDGSGPRSATRPRRVRWTG